MNVCERANCSRPARTRRLCSTHYEQLRRAGLLAVREKGPVERFWTWVDRTSKCWLWTGSKSTGGYGRVFWDGKQRQAHRIAYELVTGAIPGGMELDHLCRVRHCVNPAHLQPVTQKENLRRGISPTALNGQKTHCGNGHEYTPENTRIIPKGRRCKACDHQRGVQKAAAEKAQRTMDVKETSCRICGAHFTYIGRRRTLCSEECRKESARKSAREHQRRKRAE